MPDTSLELVVSILAGIALAAASGFRAFLPLLIVNIAARSGWIELNPSLEFLGSDIALVAFIIASVLEIGADKIPVLDNALDVASTFLRPVTGILAGMALIADLPQPIAAGMALILGTITFGTQITRAKARLGSTAATGGLANPLMSFADDLLSGTLSFLAVLVPILAGVFVILLLIVLWKIARGVHRAAGKVLGHGDPKAKIDEPGQS